MSLSITRHTDSFATLGQIAPDHIAEIASLGFKSVINNRPDGEGGPDQPSNASIQAEAEKLGLNYVYSALFAMILSNYLYAAFTDKDYHQAFLFSYRQAIMAFVIHASLSIQKLL